MASPKNRPTGIVIIAVVWILSSVWNLYQGLNGIIIDLEALPYLSSPNMPEWFRFGVPAEMMIAFFVVAFGFLGLFLVYGLLTAKSWSYHLALASPVIIIVLNMTGMWLYASSPPELELRGAVGSAVPFLVMNFVFLVSTWGYLMQPHVKQYLNRIPTPPPTPIPVPVTQSALPVPPPPMPVATLEEKKYCRYCGAQSRTDAVFCEKCGKKIV